MRSVLSALTVLENVAALQPVGVSEVARLTGLPKSSVQRCLLTLRDAGWISTESVGPPRWRLTAHAREILLQSSGELTLRDAAIPIMQYLRDETGETVFLAALDGIVSVLIERVDGTQPVRTFNPLGVRMNLNASSTGKALLAAMNVYEIEEVLAQDLEVYTNDTITDTDQLRAEIAQIRCRGYAINKGEWRPDVSGIGAAVVNSRGKPVAAVSISMPSFRFDESKVPELGALVIKGAQDISSSLRSDA